MLGGVRATELPAPEAPGESAAFPTQPTVGGLRRVLQPQAGDGLTDAELNLPIPANA
jgi:hypothetical protein